VFEKTFSQIAFPCAKSTCKGKEFAVFDLFRIENGKIVEHRDNTGI